MRRSLRVLRASLIGLVAVIVLVAGIVSWLLHRPSGGAWLLAHLPGVQIEEPQGSLMGEFSARRLVITWPGGSAELRGLRWKGLGLTASSGLLLAEELSVDDLAIRSQASGEPLQPPPDLSLPLGVQIGSLRIARLSWAPDHPPLLGLEAQLDLPRRGTHQIQLKAARWQHLTMSGKA
ncbi:MAG: hypothetical protein K9J82_07155, partial [Methylotenera sp.]|nr:hypothetical protein [Methylotenera sp.]